MRRRLWWIVLAVVALLAVGGAYFIHWVLYTEPGLQFALRQLDRVPKVHIEVTGARGTLAGPLDLGRVVVDHEAVHIEARDLHAVLRARNLGIGLVHLDDVAVRQLRVQLKPRPPQPKTPPGFLPAWLRIEAPGVRIDDIEVTLLGGQRIVANAAHLSLAMTRWRITADPLDVTGPQGRIDGMLALRASDPLGLITDLRGTWRLPEQAYEYRFHAVTKGRLDHLTADLTLESPAQISFRGTLLDLTETPRARGTFRFVDFDGSPWLPAGKLPQVNGTVTLAAGVTSLGLDGTFTTAALPGQQLRLQGGGRFADRRIEIPELRAWLPRIGLSFSSQGTVDLPAKDAPAGTLPHLKLAGEWTALRWPLDVDAKPVVSSPAGVYTLEGSLPYRVTLRTETRATGLPPVTIDAAALLDKEGLQLERLDGYALRGRIQGQGRLQWTGTQPWSFDVTARSLALSEFRKGVDGRIDRLAASIQGNGLSAAAPWTARLTSLSGTMYGRALTGHGEVAHRDGQFDLRDVRIANGTSHVDVNGQVGPELLALDWNVDLHSLAIITDGLRGQLASQGTAHGSLQRPEVRGTAHLTGLGFGAFAVVQANAQIDVDASDRHRSRITLHADSVDTGVLKVDTVDAGLDGYLREHTFSVQFSSPGNREHRITPFDGKLHAAGAFDLEHLSWSGNLDGLTIDFPDGGGAQLIEPAALVLGPKLQRSSPLCVRTVDDARACVEGENHAAPRSWRVIYSAEDWPLKRLLSSMLGWREFDGRLQASGWAEQAPGRDWVGGSTVLIHDPSLDIPRNKFRSEHIQLGSSRLDLYAEPKEIRANLDFEVDESTRLQGEAFVTRHPGDLMASPLRGHVTGGSEAIRLLPLLFPEVDRASGRLQGEVTLAGTLGQPDFRGDFHLRDGKVELYRTNLIISGLQADGTFAGEELRFTAQGSTPKGALNVDGKFDWPAGVMTGQMRMRGDQLLVADTPEYRVLASPDLVLHAGKDGYHVTGKIEIPTARISPREITSSVGSSPDERIVGVEDIDETNKPSTSDRVTTQVQVVLSENVRVVAYGLKARLQGVVNVSQTPDDVARGDGTIKILDGQYKAFGQDVTITKGLLTYANTPLNEPNLEIVAERKIKDSDITVAVNVRGTLEQPFISITSTPSMSSNEALSYLLTGRSLDTLQSGEAANVNQAAENLAVSGGGLLLGGIGSKLGLDEVTVEKTGDTGDTSVVLGKFLNPKLFVSYGISIAEAINTIKLRYTLNDRWAVKAEAGLEQSADVEYRIER